MSRWIPPRELTQINILWDQEFSGAPISWAQCFLPEDQVQLLASEPRPSKLCGMGEKKKGERGNKTTKKETNGSKQNPRQIVKSKLNKQKQRNRQKIQRKQKSRE